MSTFNLVGSMEEDNVRGETEGEAAIEEGKRNSILSIQSI